MCLLVGNLWVLQISGEVGHLIGEGRSMCRSLSVWQSGIENEWSMSMCGNGT